MKDISVMIVDDSRIERYILTRQLNDISIYDIFEQDDGCSALEFFADYKANVNEYNVNENNKFPPSIIFLDINMPIINGFEFLARFSKLREQLPLKSCLVIMYSSSENKEDKERVKAFDFVKGFLVKGQITPEIIRDTILAVTEQNTCSISVS